MANNLKDSPQGVDRPIQDCQVLLYEELKSLWGFSEDNFEGYGRVYKNERNGRVIPEHYKGDEEYSGNLLTTDKSKFFFTKSSRSESLDMQSEFMTQINVYFILNLNTLKGSVPNRADQEAQIDVVNILSSTELGTINNIIDTDFRTVLNEFQGLYEQKEWEDMGFHHIFKIECELIYSLTTKNC